MGKSFLWFQFFNAELPTEQSTHNALWSIHKYILRQKGEFEPGCFYLHSCSRSWRWKRVASAEGGRGKCWLEAKKSVGRRVPRTTRLLKVLWIWQMSLFFSWGHHCWGGGSGSGCLGHVSIGGGGDFCFPTCLGGGRRHTCQSCPY